MPATIRTLRTKAERLRAEKAAELRRLASEVGLSERLCGEISAEIDRELAVETDWTFVMIGPAQNAAVVNYLRKHSERPTLAMALWSNLFLKLDRATGEILFTRDELAEMIGADPDTVSRIMGELVKFGAISRRRQPIPGMRGAGRAVYFMNPRVGTHLRSPARQVAQAEAPSLRLVERTPAE